MGANGPAGTYTTDGISEPYCFEDLEPGNYMVQQTSPTGYKTTGAAELGVLLSADQTYSLEVGYVSDVAPAETPATEETPEPAEEEPADKPASSLLSTIIRVSGVVAALLAIAVGVLFFISRRKATP